MRAGGAKGRRDENAGRRIFSEMRGSVDAHGNAFAGDDGAGGDLKRGSEVVLREARTNGDSEPAVLGGNRLQQEQFLVLDEDEHAGRMKQDANELGDAVPPGVRVWRS